MMKLTDYAEDELMPSGDMPAVFPGTTPQTWSSLRHKGNGPPFIKIARRVYYRRRDVEAWINGNRMARTDLPAS